MTKIDDVKVKPRLVFPVSIMGLTWFIFVLSEEDYIKTVPDDPDCPAYTLTGLNRIVFRAGNINSGLIRHEVFHSFVHCLPIASANLNKDQFEEVIAEFLQQHWGHYCSLVDLISKQIKKARIKVVA